MDNSGRMSGTHEPFRQNGNSVFADINYDNYPLLPTGSDSTFHEPASWALNAGSEFPAQNQSRGQLPQVPSYNANHLSAHPPFSGQASPFVRSMNQSPVPPYTQNSFPNYGAQQNFQYRQQQYDPSLVTQPGNGQNYNLGIHNFSPVSAGGTITPQALQRESQPPNFNANRYGNGFPTNMGQAPANNRPVSASAPTRPVDHKALVGSIPRGADSGMFSVIDLNSLCQQTNSERMGSYVNIGKQPLEFDCTRSAVPAYIPRKSRGDYRALAGNNPALQAKIGRKSIKSKAGSTTIRPFTSSGSVSSPQNIKYEGDSSSSEDSSDDDSAYSDEDDSDSPLPPKRPSSPKEGVEYDTIKALWRSRRKHLEKDVIRKGLVDFWELVKTIRDRWKADAAAVTEAEEKKRHGELPLLESRVKDQRDMIEAAFKAALKHGHRGIIELLAENVSLLYLCYQFLLDRFKADDVNGTLARAILETMSCFTTLTKDKIDKTHLVKVFPRYQKKGDAKTQFWIKKINANAETASKEAAEKGTDQKKPEISTGLEQKAASPTNKPLPGSVAGVKRSATTTPADGTAQKKVATGTAKPNSTATASKINGVVKKPASATENAKPSGVAPVPTRKTVTSKPSGFFSNLQSASKKPGTSITDKPATLSTRPGVNKAAGSKATVPKPTFSFAETMANLSKPKEEKPAPKAEKEGPPETEEARAKRLRKERRGKLHVRFKEDSELVEIRIFSHDPQEEIDHDSSQMRDVSDVGGEGRMFKQQSQMMDIDDEDEGEDEIEILRDHTPVKQIDFSVVEKDERNRNYAPYGGGELEAESAERTVREAYESNNLIVFYTDRSQIPPNPREPVDPYNGDQTNNMKYFASPDEKFAARARTKNSQPRGARPPFTIPFGQPPPVQSSAAPTPDIQSILASLRQGAPAAQPTQPQPAFSQPFMGFQQPAIPQTSPAPAAPPGNIDLAAILASLNPGGVPQNNYGSASAAPMMNFQQAPTSDDQDTAKGRRSNYNNFKTKPCRFFSEGRCQKGDKCTYKHE